MTQQTTAGMVPQVYGFAGFPNLYLNGCQISRGGNTTLTIQPGQVRDSTNGFDLTLGSYFDDAASTPAAVTLNAAVNGANGLDSGTFAATQIYAVYVIGDPLNNLPAATLLSLSFTIPTLPFGYSVYRRIGSWAVDGSVHFVLGNFTGNSSGRKFYFDAPISVLSAGAATTATAVVLTNVVPPLDNLVIGLNAQYTANSVTDTAVLVSGGSTSTTTVVIQNAAAAAAKYPPFEMLSKLVTGVSTILYKVSSASDALTLLVTSYTDAL